MSIEQFEQTLSPEERTAHFFEQHVRELATSLQGKKVALSGDQSKQVVISETEAYGEEEEGVQPVGKNNIYRPLHDRTPGEVSVIDWKFRKTTLLLINAAGKDPATCVRVKRTEIYDPIENVFRPIKKERESAEYLGLDPTTIYMLGFQDETDTLYLSPIEETRQE